MAGPRGVLRYWCRYWRGDFYEKSMKRASSTMGLQLFRHDGIRCGQKIRENGREAQGLAGLDAGTLEGVGEACCVFLSGDQGKAEATAEVLNNLGECHDPVILVGTHVIANATTWRWCRRRW
ncbi:hypothetical protein ACFX2I_032246 [Malus domestica]